jgi:hypothetical protein
LGIVSQDSLLVDELRKYVDSSEEVEEELLDQLLAWAGLGVDQVTTVEGKEFVGPFLSKSETLFDCVK